jgi:hypothetical protein
MNNETCSSFAKEKLELIDIDVWTKIMTKDVHDPQDYMQNHTMTTFFTNRMRTGLLLNEYQTFRSVAAKKTIIFEENSFWQSIPLIKDFAH